MDKIAFKVSIIIPNYNGKTYLEKLLPSIANQTFKDYEVIIMDDCSPDRSAVEYIRSIVGHYENMRLVENNTNLGFVRNCNKGISIAKGEYICLLNNDTEVTSDFVERNAAILDADRSIGVLSCIIVDKSGKNWFVGGGFRSGLSFNLVDDFQGVREVNWVVGTACFYRSDVFSKIGLLNEDFYMYHEDIEFCLRVRKYTPYRVCMFSDKLVTHYEGNSLSMQVFYYRHRNHIFVLRLYAPEYIPKVLLRYAGEAALLFPFYLLTLRLFKEHRSFWFRLVGTIKGTKDSLFQKLDR